MLLPAYGSCKMPSTQRESNLTIWRANSRCRRPARGAGDNYPNPNAPANPNNCAWLVHDRMGSAAYPLFCQTQVTGGCLMTKPICYHPSLNQNRLSIYQLMVETRARSQISSLHTMSSMRRAMFLVSSSPANLGHYPMRLFALEH